jgi:predicted metal-dependent hydrolase
MYMIMAENTLNQGSAPAQPEVLPAKPRQAPAWNQATARLAAAKSLDIRRKKAAQAKILAALAAQHALTVKLPAPVEPDAVFVSKQINQLREHIDRLHTLISKARDAQTIDKLSSAIAKLAEQERILAGRPLPGSHRSSKQRAEKVAAAADALELPDHLVAQVQQLDTQ